MRLLIVTVPVVTSLPFSWRRREKSVVKSASVVALALLGSALARPLTLRVLVPPPASSPEPGASGSSEPHAVNRTSDSEAKKVFIGGNPREQFLDDDSRAQPTLFAQRSVQGAYDAFVCRRG